MHERQLRIGQTAAPVRSGPRCGAARARAGARRAREPRPDRRRARALPRRRQRARRRTRPRPRPGARTPRRSRRGPAHARTSRTSIDRSSGASRRASASIATSPSASPLRGAGLRQIQELRGRGRMRAGASEVAPLDPRARQALLERPHPRARPPSPPRAPRSHRRRGGPRTSASASSRSSPVSWRAGAGRDGLARGGQARIEIGGVEAADPHEDLARRQPHRPAPGGGRRAPRATASPRPPRPAPRRPRAACSSACSWSGLIFRILR